MPHIIRGGRASPCAGKRVPRRRTILFGALLVLVLAYGAFALIVRSSHTFLPGNEVRAPGRIANLPGLSAPEASTARINILVLGIDHRPGKGNEYLPYVPGQPDDPGRSDTMALFSVDPVTKTASILSIPRDLWVEVQDGHGGWNIDRINEAYHTGEVDKLPGGGGQTAAAAVTHNFGIPIDHYVALDFAGFTALVDALGGIDLDVPNTLTATVLPRLDSGGYDYTYFAGKQHLNGELALAYSRFRLDTEGDFGRIKRQQAVVLAAQQEALSLGWIDQPLSVWNRYNSAVRTDVPSYQLPGYALLAKQMQGRGITARSLGEPGATRETVIPGSGADVLLPNPDAIARIVSEALDSPSLGAATLARLRSIYPGTASESTGSLPSRPVVPQLPASPQNHSSEAACVAAPTRRASAAQFNPGPAGLAGSATLAPQSGAPLGRAVVAPAVTSTPRSAPVVSAAVVAPPSPTPARALEPASAGGPQQPASSPGDGASALPAPAAATAAAR